MKKVFILALALGFSLVGSAQRTFSPSASTEVYDFKGIGDELITLFHDAFAQGRNCPTEAELEAVGINKIDLNFVRSHVRPRSIMVDHSKDVNKNVTTNRQLWMNIPTGIGKKQGGYPNGNGSDDCYTLWNYTNLFGSWNHGLFNTPAVWTDCAHKNGTDIMSGIKFFESWGSGDGEWVKVVSTKNDLTSGPSAKDTYKYSRAIIYALMFMGQDGINYNWEDNSYTNADVVAFHQELYKIAKEVGFTNYHSGIYTSNNSITARSNVKALFGEKSSGKTHDLMLNYSAGDFTPEQNMATSVQTAVSKMGTYEGLYAGVWVAGLDKSWKSLAGSSYADAKKIGVCIWGEHAQSRIYSFTQGDDPVKYSDNYQKQQEMFASGGNRNPAMRPTPINNAAWGNLTTFQGLAEYIPERTAIQGDLPFVTHFNVGAGERFNYKGKKTLGKWYNMGCQDIVPTYRWLVYNTGTKNPAGDAPEFTQEDSYTGGSCLRLKGTEQDIVLYRTKLAVNGRPQVSVAMKDLNDQYFDLSVIVKIVGDDEWKETKLARVESTEWEEQTVNLSGVMRGDEIEYIGLRTNGDANGMLIGKLAITDGSAKNPSAIKDVLVEVKEETTESMSIKLAWNVDKAASDRAAYELLYNDEANIDHFEVLYKNGESGRVSLVAKTTSWSALVPNIAMSEGEEPYIGVRPVSVDQQTYGDIIWTKVERSSDVPEPSANGNYPESVISADADGYAKAIETRYVRTFKTSGASGKNINYTQNSHPCSDGTNYYLAQNNELVVKQGDQLTATFKVNGTNDDKQDGLYYCCYKAYMDFDQNFMFNSSNDEVVDSHIVTTTGGQITNNATADYLYDSNGHTFTIQIPEDAVTGPSRLRIVFSDAWFPHPGPSGYTQKGFTLDFPVTIMGNNPAREPEADTHDQGVADEPENIVPTAIEEVHEGAVPAISEKDGIYTITGADKVWIYTADGRYVNRDLNSVGNGTYLVRMQSGNVIRTRKIVK